MDNHEAHRVSEPFSPVDSRIEAYMRALAKATDCAVLMAMEQMARERGFPIVDRLVGLFLESLTKLHGARKIFEFGSGYGYSAYWFARGAGPESQIICCDGDPANRKLAQRFLTQAGFWNNIDYQVGMAQDIFQATADSFDICYNDADKGDYPEIWRMARDRIVPGGLYIADNVLWSGRVAMVPPVQEFVQGWTEAIHEHNCLIFSDPEFDAWINPTRDGVIVARKKSA